ncbi:MAG: hypothetical protein AB7F43_13310 [Bacteriovoracia bacterium]
MRKIIFKNTLRKLTVLVFVILSSGCFEATSVAWRSTSSTPSKETVFSNLRISDYRTGNSSSDSSQIGTSTSFQLSTIEIGGATKMTGSSTSFILYGTAN